MLLWCPNIERYISYFLTKKTSFSVLLILNVFGKCMCVERSFFSAFRPFPRLLDYLLLAANCRTDIYEKHKHAPKANNQNLKTEISSKLNENQI